MRNCTGEQYNGQRLSLLSFSKWHGKFGHVNAIKLDHDSYVTGHGAHDRVIVTMPEGNKCYCRIDHVWDLGMPTEKQIIACMKAWPNEIKGRWKVVKTEAWPAWHDKNGKSTDVYLERA